MNIDEEKAKIRKEMLRRRSGISSAALSEIDKTLPVFILSIEDEELQDKLHNAKRIALYRAFKGEVPVDGSFLVSFCFVTSFLYSDGMGKAERSHFPHFALKFY